MTNPAVRFAPSPTGHLHVGNMRTALINWLYAHKAGGSFLLRIDDTDRERSRPEFEAAIIEDMTWLGLTWDRLERQSDRLDRYAEAIKSLTSAGHLYACYETPEELDRKRNLQRSSGRPPIYDRAGLKLTDAEKLAFEADGRRPHWRFRLEPENVTWTDLFRGQVTISTETLSDPVLVRSDGVPLYTLSSIIDDVDFEIDTVIRGEDHVSNTAVQVQLYRAVGGVSVTPEFGHFSLLMGAEGEGLSKRFGSLSIQDLRNEGVEAMTINNFLARIGTPDPVQAHLRMEDIVAGFDFRRFGRASPRFDPRELEKLNGRILHQLEFDDVASRLQALGMTGVTPEFWNVVRRNIEALAEASDWWHIVSAPIQPDVTDKALLKAAAKLLPKGAWDEAAWNDWTTALREKTGKKGRELFMPLRLALTGLDHGPEMRDLLPLIGYERAHKRLQGKRA